MVEPLVARLAVRETLERYLNHLDDENWDGVAACFTPDAISYFNHEPQALHGGGDVAAWLRRALAAASGTNHALSNLRVELDGDVARSDSRVMATLHWGEPGRGRVTARAIRYRDELVEHAGVWLIRRRRHEPQWQYDALSARPQLPG